MIHWWKIQSHEPDFLLDHYGNLNPNPSSRPNFVNPANSCVNLSPFYSHQPEKQDGIISSDEMWNPTCVISYRIHMVLVWQNLSQVQKYPKLKIHLQNKNRQHQKDQSKLTEQKEWVKTSKKLAHTCIRDPRYSSGKFKIIKL